MKTFTTLIIKPSLSDVNIFDSHTSAGFIPELFGYEEEYQFIVTDTTSAFHSNVFPFSTVHCIIPLRRDFFGTRRR